MDSFESFLHLLIGFLLLGVLIDIGETVACLVRATLGVLFAHLVSLTFSDVLSVLSCIALEAYAVRSALTPPSMVPKDIPHVVFYEGPSRCLQTSDQTKALINVLAVMSLVSTAVGSETDVGSNVGPILVPIAVVRYFNLEVGLVSHKDTLLPVYIHALTFAPPLIRAPSLYLAHELSLEVTRQQYNVSPSHSLDVNLREVCDGLELAPLNITVKPVLRPHRLPFDVSDLFRGQPLPVPSKEDLEFWHGGRPRTGDADEPLRARIDVGDLNTACISARSVPASTLFPSVSEGHIGLRPQRELPPRPFVPALPVPAAPAPAPEVLHVAAPRKRASVHRTLFKPPCVATPSQFRTGATVTAHMGARGNFKWSMESGVSLMEALGVGSVKLGVVYSLPQ